MPVDLASIANITRGRAKGKGQGQTDGPRLP